MHFPFTRVKGCKSKKGLYSNHVQSSVLLHRRTSDSLNEGLPIKMARKKFHGKRQFFHQKNSRFNARIIR